MKYEPVIGLEIHAELKTRTKMFCYSLNDPNELHPNTNICPICMGHPGTLPIINEEAVKKVILAGLAIGGTIPEFSQFDRKNYFYPDLPKGYQISQYQHPLVENGSLIINGKKIRIRRIHLEEDTGRLMHDPKTEESLVDFNRAGVPLMELVTEPDFKTSEDIKLFGEELQKILRYIGASDANMERGQMRVEVNISLRPEGSAPDIFGTKVEIKNINSFKFAADAAEFEMKRQAALLDQEEKIAQETRGWNEHKQETFSQRLKEEAHDYRYFPEPDLPALSIKPEFVEEIRALLPELPEAKSTRFIHEYSLDKKTTDLLSRDKSLADYFESTVSELAVDDTDTPEKSLKNAGKTVASFITSELLGLLNKNSISISELRVTPAELAPLILFIAENKISNLTGKEVLGEMFHTGEHARSIIDKKGLWQTNDASALESIARNVIAANPAAIQDYRAGKNASVQFLIGQAMKESRGKADPKVMQDIIKRLLADS